MSSASEVQHATRILSEHRREWFSVPGVSAAGITLRQGRVCIVINIAAEFDRTSARFPQILDGVPIHIERGDISVPDQID